MRLSHLRPPLAAYFESRQETGDLGRRSARGSLISVISQFIRFSAQLLATAILARLLDPEDFGYLAMATVLINLLKMFSSSALTTGIVQQRTITHRQLSGFFWISAGFALVLSLVAVALAPLVSWFFKESVLIGIGAVMALQIAFAGVSSSHSALLSRAMSFGLVSMIDLAAGILSKIVGIAAAFWGAGYWALIVIPVAQDGIKALLVWYFCTWRPSFQPITRDSSALLKFGAKMSLSSIFNTFSQQIDGILIGRYWDSASLGLYSKSLNLVQLPAKLICWPLEIIAVSTLSRMQDDTAHRKQLFLAIVENFTFFTAPLITMLYLTAPDVVYLVLGPKWSAAVPIFKYLSLYMLVQTIAAPIDWFLISTARLRKYMTIVVAGNVVRVAAIVIGLPHGPTGVAIAMLIAMAIHVPLIVWYALRHTDISLADYGRAIARVAVAIAGSGLLTLAVEHYLLEHIDSHLFALIAFAGLDYLLYLGLILLLPGGRKSVAMAVDTLRFMLKRTRSAAPAKGAGDDLGH